MKSRSAQGKRNGFLIGKVRVLGSRPPRPGNKQTEERRVQVGAGAALPAAQPRGTASRSRRRRPPPAPGPAPQCAAPRAARLFPAAGGGPGASAGPGLFIALRSRCTRNRCRAARPGPGGRREKGEGWGEGTEQRDREAPGNRLTAESIRGGRWEPGESSAAAALPRLCLTLQTRSRLGPRCAVQGLRGREDGPGTASGEGAKRAGPGGRSGRAENEVQAAAPSSSGS